jgi:hypothetical protein
MSRYIPIDECKVCPHLKVSTDFSDPLQTNEDMQIWTCGVEDKTIVSRKEKGDPDPEQPDWCPLSSLDDVPGKAEIDDDQNPKEIRLLSLEVYPDFSGCYLPIQRREEVFRFQAYNRGLTLTHKPNKSRWNTAYIHEQVKLIAESLERRLNGSECPSVSRALEFLEVVDPLIEDAVLASQDAIDAFIDRTKPVGGQTRMLVGVRQGSSGMGIEVTLKKSDALA